MSQFNTEEEAASRNHAGASLTGGRKATGSFASMNLPGFIGHLLGQYQDLLVGQVENEIKNQVLAAVREQTYMLRWQTLQRLCSWESVVQQRVQEILGEARERIFDLIHRETKAVYAELQGRLEALLEEASASVAPETAESAPGPVAGALVKPGQPDAGALGIPQGDGETTEAGEKGEVHPQEVRLELLPPLEVKPLLWFYQGLLEKREVSVIRTVGSLERGVLVYIRQKESSSLAEVLRGLPGVVEVREEVPPVSAAPPDPQGAGERLTLRVLLMPAGEGNCPPP